MSSIRCVLIFLSILFLSGPVFGQQDPKQTARDYMQVAEEMIAGSQALDDARGLMVLAADLDTTFLKANYDAGYLHLLTIGKDLAVKYFLRVYRQNPNYRFDLEYWIGKSYQYGLDFDNAIKFYNLYKQRLLSKPNYQGNDKIPMETVDKGIVECMNGKEFVANPGNFSIVNIGREINSEYEDYAPVMNESEDEIIFTTRRRDGNLNANVADDNKPYEDIFMAKKVNGVWSYAANIGDKVNTPYHDSNLALSADGKTLYILKDDGGGDIYYCTQTPDGKWGAPVPLPGIINSSFEEKSITISKDGKTLYFSSNRPGGFGGTDLYKATKDAKGNWANVKNLGPKINTPFDEEGPFIDYDMVTLYFSSKGHKNMGSYDIFKSVYDPVKNDWSEPENLGYPINTPDDDIFYVVSADGKRAYYSSVRDDGLGYTDIYLITTPEGMKDAETTPLVEATTPEVPVTPVVETPKQPEKEQPKPVEKSAELKPLRYVVRVTDAGTRTTVPAKVSLKGLNDNVVVGSTTTEPGVYEFRITSAAAKDYRLSVEKEGYAFINQTVNIRGAGPQEQTLNRTVELRKLNVGTTSVLRNIYFDYDKATFKTESYSDLNKLEQMMRQNPNIRVEIAGHTDSFGHWEYNKALSQRRAEAVKDFLTKKGIDPRRITAVGYGESRPLASNDDEQEGRELNRRVEFKVIQN
jgi:outer membrane protein OmpA-like peptidoglycan-associated protein